MEHIKIKYLGDGYSKLSPEKGYKLMNTRTQTTHSTAIIKDSDMKFWVAVEM